MRRFEYVDGTSSKFWEIDLQGAAFTVRWGRIGTSGQTQEKSFPSADKAEAEHNKLIAEKLKKGYSEVGGDAQASPAPALAAAPKPKKASPAPAASAPAAKAPVKEVVTPAPARAEPPPAAASEPSSDAPIAWTDSLLRRVHPRRGGVRVPVRALAALKKAWAAVREDFAKLAPLVHAGKEKSGKLGKRMEAILGRMLGEEPAIGTPEDDAILLTILAHRQEWRDKRDVDPLVDLLFALGGPAHATQAVLGSLGLHIEGKQGPHDYKHSGPYAVKTGQDKGWWNAFDRGHLRGLPRLRALLVTWADEAGYAAARDAAAALRDSATLEQRAGAAFLFPTERRWVHAEAQALAQGKGLDLVLCSIQDRDELAPLGPIVGGYTILAGEKDYVPSILDGVGSGALVFLRAVQASGSSADGRRVWAEAVAAINSDEAMELLLEALDKDVMPYANEAAARWPRRALRLLSARAAARGKAADAPRALLASLVRRERDLVLRELPGLPEESKRVIQSLQEQSGPDVPDAPPERLPPVLARPPWRAGAPASLPVVDGVTGPEVPDGMVWLDGEKEEWAQREGWSHGDYSDYTDKDWKALEKRLAKEERPGATFFVRAPEAMARAHIAQFDPNPYGEQLWLPAIVARLELDALPAILTNLTNRANDPYEHLQPYAVAKLAPLMANALARTKTVRPVARAWLARHPVHATAGLLPVALGKPGKDKEAACAALRWLAANGEEATVLEVAGRVSKEVREAVGKVLAFDPLLLFPRRLPNLPDFFEPAALPRPLLADRSARLPVEAIEAIGTMLAFNDPEEPYPGLAQVKEACDPASLARFAWGLFEAWMTAGSPSKEGWAFQALGIFGDDECARKLAPLIRQWPGEAAHARAVAGLDVLAAIGTDVTLVYLNGIAEKVAFKGLQGKAQEKIAEIAEARGLTRDELADRLVPTLGLDDNGSMQLDFGGRTFTVGFDEQLKPFVKDAEGARLKDLPKPSSKDDAEKANAAVERWKALKKDAKAAAGIQVLRMELGMCGKRRWSAGLFRQFFVEHPLLIHVVRRLVWGTYDAKDRLTGTFRVAEDRTFADVNDDAWTLPGDAKVGIPHALELNAETAGRWGQVFADYQILQPFPQLGRPTYAITPEEKKGFALERVKNLKVPTGKVLGLEARGWRRGQPQDAGVVCWMEKHLGPDRRIELDLNPGLYTGMLSESPEQTLGDVTVRTPNSWGDGGRFPLDELDPILFSELVRDLEGLRS